jgi:hypothetical protein
MTVTARTYLDSSSEAYVADVLDTIGAYGSQPVVGAFVLGSGLLGGFDARTSDIDLVAVVAHPLDPAARAALIHALDAVPSPARKLELVVYTAGAKPPQYELNYPEGAGEPAHWFVLDAAIAQERAQPFVGRPWRELLDAVSESEVRRAAQESLEWSARQPPDDDFARLNATRARHYLEHGEWISKKEAEG